MEAVREALARAQEAADYSCLMGAAAWGALAGGRARRAALLNRSPRVPAPPAALAAPPAPAPPSTAPACPRHTAAAAQLLAQHIAVNGAKPSYIFQVDIIYFHYFSFINSIHYNDAILYSPLLYINHCSTQQKINAHDLSILPCLTLPLPITLGIGGFEPHTGQPSYVSNNLI